MKNKQVQFQDWGLIDYQQAWDKQQEIFDNTVKLKVDIRNRQVAAAMPAHDTPSDLDIVRVNCCYYPVS